MASFMLGTLLFLLVPLIISIWLGDRSPLDKNIRLDHLHLFLAQLLIACLWSYSRAIGKSDGSRLLGQKRKAAVDTSHVRRRDRVPLEWRDRLQQMNRDYLQLAKASRQWPQIQRDVDDDDDDAVHFYAPLPADLEPETEDICAGLKMEAHSLIGVEVSRMTALLWDPANRQRLEPMWDNITLNKQLNPNIRLITHHLPGGWLRVAREACFLERQQALPDGSILLLACTINSASQAMAMSISLQASLIEPTPMGCKLTRWWRGVEMGGMIPATHFIHQLMEHLPRNLPRPSGDMMLSRASSQLALRFRMHEANKKAREGSKNTTCQSAPMTGAMPNGILDRAQHRMIMSIVAPSSLI